MFATMSMLSITAVSEECLLQELMEVLGIELRLYHKMLGILYVRREHLRKGNIISFEETSKEVETTVLRIKILEEARKAIASRLAHLLGIPSERITLTELSMQVDKPYNEDCMAYQKEILPLIRESEHLAMKFDHSLYYTLRRLETFYVYSANTA